MFYYFSFLWGNKSAIGLFNVEGGSLEDLLGSDFSKDDLVLGIGGIVWLVHYELVGVGE